MGLNLLMRDFSSIDLADSLRVIGQLPRPLRLLYKQPANRGPVVMLLATLQGLL